MILSALNDYYQRKSADPDAQMARYGYEWKGIDLILVLDSSGELIGINDTREQEGKRQVPKLFLVPQGIKKTSGVAANLLWDNPEYVLGIGRKDKPDRIEQQVTAFLAKITQFGSDKEDTGLNAVSAFLGCIDHLKIKQAFPEQWKTMTTTPVNVSFRLQGDEGLICQRTIVMELYEAQLQSDTHQQVCLVSGNRDEPERIHASIKGVWGAQTSGANIVSFNLDAVTSYGKEQGANAPVGKQAAFAYTTALNHLLRSNSQNRIQVSDTSTVFWADKETPLEEDLAAIFSESPKDDPDRNTYRIRNLISAVTKGGYTEDDELIGFYLLGLAPNASRIAVRFWEQGSVRHIAQRIAGWFHDIEMVRALNDQEYPSLFRLLTSIAVQNKVDNIPPNLGGELLRAIVRGTPYPNTLLQAAIRRIRSEQQVGYLRASLIKACFNRSNRSLLSNQKEITVALDLDNQSSGYLLGRLFAVLERIQEEGHGGRTLNQTIRDKYYGAASSSPLSVFSTLMKLKNHHLAKISNRGRVVNLERLIGEIHEPLRDYPAQMPLHEQGLFAIGYYHQRQAFFTSKAHNSDAEGEKNE